MRLCDESDESCFCFVHTYIHTEQFRYVNVYTIYCMVFDYHLKSRKFCITRGILYTNKWPGVRSCVYLSFRHVQHSNKLL